MKFAISSTLILALSSMASTADANKPHVDYALRQEFVQAMNKAIGEKKRESHINRMLLTAAKPMNQPEFMRPRILDEEEEADQQEEEEGQQEEEEQQEKENYDYAIDLSNYALKYVGCSNIHTYSEELAETYDATTILEMNRFVVLRLCPKESCSNYYEYGCTSGYGDYMIEMGDYLEIMSENYFTDYTEYCETCYHCLHPNADDDGGNAENDNGYYGWNDYAQDDDAGGNCRYSDVCMNYWTACKDYSSQASQLEQYFECSQFYMGDSNAYLGPHCGSDGKTIGIGVYTDEYCNDYKKDLGEVSSYIGVNLGNDYLKSFHSDNCISCQASEGYSLEYLDGNNNADDDGGDDISDICYSLYGAAAKCNKYLGNDGDINSEVQEANEETVCTFIHNIVTQTYDEYGEIYLGGGSLVKFVSKYNHGQQWALTLSILVVLVLSTYAAYLHRRVSRNRAWKPRVGYSNDPLSKLEDIGREHSGIISGRSYDKTSGYLV